MYSYIFDNGIKLCLCDIVDLLNSFSDVILAYDKRIAELKRENEQLRQAIDNIYDSYESYYGMSLRNADWLIDESDSDE